MRQAFLSLATLMLVACSAEPLAINITASDKRSVVVPVGTELDLITVTVGPGEYASPPAISSDVLRFVTVQYVGPFTPGGPRQQFRFVAVAKGGAIVRFHHTGNNADIADTVVVR